MKSQVTNNTFTDSSENEHDNEIEKTGITFDKPDWKVINIDFLSSYYEQDGNNGAVTGGIGTERLTDFTQKIIVSLPIKENFTINFDAGYDYYSSASTDNISLRSDDSASDMRTHANVGFSIQKNKQHSFGMRIGGSKEYDYTSLQAGLNYSWLSKDQNTSLGLSSQVFVDDWLIIYPRELRRQGPHVPTDKRQSYNTSLTWSQVLNKKMQFSLQLEGVLMKGLLSTPFHRVFFQEEEQARVEQLPSSRLKIPIGLRLNSYLTDGLISRLYYRYYWDDWNVRSHTVMLELPIKIHRFFSIFPSYRFHHQTSASYFAPFKEHESNQVFYTSDYDLSAFTSQSFGLGLHIFPSQGISKVKIPFSKHRQLHVEGIELKVSHYRRSTDLNANIISLGIKMQVR